MQRKNAIFDLDAIARDLCCHVRPASAATTLSTANLLIGAMIVPRVKALDRASNAAA